MNNDERETEKKDERKCYRPHVIYEIFKLSSDVSGRWKLMEKYGFALRT